MKHEAEVTAVAISPDATLLVSGADSHDPTLRIWTISDGTSEVLPKPHNGGVTCIRFAPNGATFASAGKDGEIRVWDTKTRKVLWDVFECNYVYCVAFSPDGRLAASGGTDGMLRLRDAGTGKLRMQLGPRTDWVKDAKPTAKSGGKSTVDTFAGVLAGREVDRVRRFRWGDSDLGPGNAKADLD